MKKAMMGILILIPIIVLIIVALVSTIVSVQAWIAVDDIVVNYKGTEQEADTLVIDYDGIQTDFDLEDYLDVTVLPTRANMYTLEWSIVGDVQCTDLSYATRYQAYLDSLESGDTDVEHMDPVVGFVDGKGAYAMSSTSGKIKVNSYCRFTVMLQAESISRTVSLAFDGHVPNAVALSAKSSELRVGQTLRLRATYDPLGSIVNDNVWSSSNTSVATVDDNGVVKAVGAGSADITVSTTREDGQVITSPAFTVTVTAAASALGDKLTISSRSVSCAQLGIDPADVDAEGSVGISLVDSNIVFSGENATIKTSNGDITVNFCDENDIEIYCADEYDMDSGFVLGVGPLKLSLSAVWADDLRSGAPENVEWSSEFPHVLTVRGGECTPLSSGIVTVTAKYTSSDGAEHTSSLRLNVQQKLDTVMLKTDDASLQAGLARETVFASERFENFAAGMKERVPNGVNILVRGEPVRSDYGSDAEFKEARKIFYSALDFEVTEGGEYASFGDVNDPNRLTFNSAALEGKGKQVLTVKVSAKFPKYESEEALKLTTAYVHVSCVYGVEAEDYYQVMEGARLQKEYASREGNFLPEKLEFESVPNPKDGRTLKLMDGIELVRNYAICLSDNILFPDGMTIGYEELIELQGDMYGNGNMISANNAVLHETLVRWYWDAHIINIGRSGITLSNVVIRPQELRSGTLDEDSVDYIAMCGIGIEDYMDSGSHNNSSRHMHDVRIEYCIVENCETGLRPNNANYTMEGCIIRNCTSSGIYNHEDVEEHSGELYLYHTEVTLINMIASNNLGTTFGYTYERVTLNNDKSPRFANTRAESEQWFKENVADKGYTGKIIQKGFLDIYNWMNVNGAKLIRTGMPEMDNLIGTLGGDMLKYHKYFDDARYEYNGDYYYHLGFFVSGISTGQGIMDEELYLETSFEDKRYICKYARDLVDENGEPQIPVGSQYTGARVAAKALSNMSIWLYGYSNKSTLTPASTYTINAQLISHLHGEA